MRRLHLLTIAMAAVLLVGCSSPVVHSPHGKIYEEPQAAPALALIDHTGQPFDLTAHRGNVVLVFFGFTHCPDICPTALADLARVRQQLGSAAARLQVVFVAVDPERDTQELLAHYVTAFDPSFVGLRGTAQELAPVIADYRVKVQRTELPGSALGYSMDHSAFIFVIDGAGNLRQRLIHGVETVDEIVADVRALL
ncbi:SCO family protein [Candidatus Gracilibacteria bacterium]|nr:SCO family protein [Candidatus Gracilibacteria bacterium]